MQEKLFEQTVDDFANFVVSQQPSAKEKKEPKDLEILSGDGHMTVSYTHLTLPTKRIV